MMDTVGNGDLLAAKWVSSFRPVLVEFVFGKYPRGIAHPTRHAERLSGGQSSSEGYEPMQIADQPWKCMSTLAQDKRR